MPDKRFCYYLDRSMYEEGRGFRPVVVYEDEGGYHKQGTLGDITKPYPWYWGHDFEAALQICQEKNASLGLSPEDVAEIIASSFRAAGRR